MAVAANFPHSPYAATLVFIIAKNPSFFHCLFVGKIQFYIANMFILWYAVISKLTNYCKYY